MAFTYSVMLDVSGRSVLVVGGGDVAARKILRVMKTGADITVITPSCNDQIRRLQNRQALRLIERPFEMDDIAKVAPFLVFAATNDQALNQEIAEYCTAHDILVNTITDPENGNFSVQSEIRRAFYSVSVSTYGQGPGFSKALREYLEPILDERLDLAVEVYIGIRAWLFAIIGDTQIRTEQLRRISLERICAMIDEGINDYDELLEKVKEWLSSSSD